MSSNISWGLTDNFCKYITGENETYLNEYFDWKLETMPSIFSLRSDDYRFENLSSLWNPFVGIKIQDSVFFWICLVVAVVGVAGNSVVILTITRTKKLHTPTYIVLASLAITDIMLVVAYFVHGSSVLEYVLEPYARFWDGHSWTVFYTVKQYALFSLFPFISAWHIVIFTGLRYFLIIYPFRSRIYVTKRNTFLLIAGAWLLPIIIMTVAALLPQTNTTAKSMIILYYLGYYVVPLTLLVMCHCVKLHTLREQQHDSTQHTNVPSLASRKMNIMSAVVVLCYFVFLFPIFLHSILYLKDVNIQMLYDISITSIMVNSCVNPIIYTLLSKTFRESFRNICRFRIKLCSGATRNEFR